MPKSGGPGQQATPKPIKAMPATRATAMAMPMRFFVYGKATSCRPMCRKRFASSARRRSPGTVPGRFEILIVTNVKKLDDREIHVSMIEPALCISRCRPTPNATPTACRRRIGSPGASSPCTSPSKMGFAPGPTCAPLRHADRALHYFVELTCHPDPAHFDLLPFDVLSDKRELQAANAR